jgi:hypothetical protein
MICSIVPNHIRAMEDWLEKLPSSRGDFLHVCARPEGRKVAGDTRILIGRFPSRTP